MVPRRVFHLRSSTVVLLLLLVLHRSPPRCTPPHSRLESSLIICAGVCWCQVFQCLGKCRASTEELLRSSLCSPSWRSVEGPDYWFLREMCPWVMPLWKGRGIYLGTAGKSSKPPCEHLELLGRLPSRRCTVGNGSNAGLWLDGSTTVGSQMHRDSESIILEFDIPPIDETPCRWIH